MSILPHLFTYMKYHLFLLYISFKNCFFSAMKDVLVQCIKHVIIEIENSVLILPASVCSLLSALESNCREQGIKTSHRCVALHVSMGKPQLGEYQICRRCNIYKIEIFTRLDQTDQKQSSYILGLTPYISQKQKKH